MSLNRILKKKNLIVVGLNSGTSADGLDLAAVKINLFSKTPTLKFIKGVTVGYPKAISHLINDAIANEISSIDTLIELDRKLGAFYGEQANKFCQVLAKNKIYPDMIASHGQTIRHLPGKVKIGRKFESGTLQLGHPETISNKTGLLTIADFRQADIAVGGEGAPITCWAMKQLFASKNESRMLINIGGIANYFFIPKKSSTKKMIAADCGPGNSLIDIITLKYFGKRFDYGGQLAAKGKISFRLLTILMADNFLKGKYGPSTGKERFGEKFANKIISYGSKMKLKKHDILATTTELTAVSIVNSIEQIIKNNSIDKIYLLGGGTSNHFLLKRLEANLPGVRFFSVDRLSFNPDYLEAVCYAIMGAGAISGLPTVFGYITGARENSLGGRIVQPSRIIDYRRK